MNYTKNNNINLDTHKKIIEFFHLNSIRAEETNTRSINIKQSDKKSKYSHKDRPKNKDKENKKSETNYETTSNKR